MNLKDIKPATMRQWIKSFVVDVGEEYEKEARELSAQGVHGPAGLARAKAEAAWRIVKGIDLGAFKPAPRRRSPRAKDAKR